MYVSSMETHGVVNVHCSLDHYGPFPSQPTFDFLSTLLYSPNFTSSQRVTKILIASPSIRPMGLDAGLPPVD